MSKKFLLDCSLRDGGYINDWEFGNNVLVSVLDRLCDAGVDVVEVGFLDDRRPFDKNRSIFPNTDSINNIYGNCKKNLPMLVAMIDYGTCSISSIKPCNESIIDGIRVIFKKQRMYEAMKFCAELKKLGYKVFSQLVSITSYKKSDLEEITSLVNEVKPYAVSLVDTYGLLTPESLLEYYSYLDENVESEIQIGFHAHNNLQLAFANCRAFLGKKTTRNILVDGTLFGMGKSAGNAPIELLAQYMNEEFSSSYKVGSLVESISEVIIPLSKKYTWGYQTLFFLSAKHKCHPNYVNYFLKKNNLNWNVIDSLLDKIPDNDLKLLYDEKFAEDLYQDYLLSILNDTRTYEKLSSSLEGKSILLIGPGNNAYLEKDKIIKFLKENDSYTISVNYIPDYLSPDFLFISKNNRYIELENKLNTLHVPIKIIATSNLSERNSKFDFVLNRLPLLEENEKINDNAFLMLIKALKQANITHIYCAGFDGYSQHSKNFFDSEMEYDFIRDITDYLNVHITDMIKAFRKDITIDFITTSKYDLREDLLSGTY